MTMSASGYFTDDSMLRRIHRERTLALSHPRALLMQAAHPLAVSGLLAHSDALEDPYERLARTAKVMSTIGFGRRTDADRITKHVRMTHRKVRGTLKEDVGPYRAGTAYRADDPELLLWVLFTLVDSALVVYRKYIGRLDPEEEAAYWEDFKVVGKLFGLRPREMPDGIPELDDYRREMLDGDRLHVTPWARDRARKIVLEPPVRWAVRPALTTFNFITVALLPDQIRRQYGFSPLPPAVLRRALVSGGAEYVKRLVIPVLPARLRFVPSARGG